jgi:extradiol dioxygenase family protein
MREGATTLTSPVDGCTLTIRRVARGLRRMVTATRLPSMRRSSRRDRLAREVDLDGRMDFLLPAGLASLAIRLNKPFDMTRHRFHLAFPVRDLDEARAFYGGLLDCPEGRSAEEWVDFDFFGHQIVAHLSPAAAAHKAHNLVDGQAVPVRHFGVILSLPEWQEIAGKLRAKGVRFLIEPTVRFRGEPGEQATMFFADPSGNALEIKAFASDAMVFAR